MEEKGSGWEELSFGCLGELVCRPKDQGGLGVINLIAQNNFLLMKHLHKFYNRANLPWPNLVWEVYYSSSLCLPSQRMCLSGGGTISRVFLFTNRLPYDMLVLTHQLVPGAAQKEISTLIFLHRKWKYYRLLCYWLESLQDHFKFPLSTKALAEFHQLQHILENIPKTDNHDKWVAFFFNSFLRSLLPISLPCISTLYTQIYNGSGKHVVQLSTRCSFGSWFLTGRTLDINCRGRISLCLITFCEMCNQLLVQEPFVLHLSFCCHVLKIYLHFL
jgi:hypothetical protein